LYVLSTDEILAFASRIEAATRALGKRDTERLNALESNLWFVEPQYQFFPAQYQVGKPGTWSVKKSLRDAIDAAIRKSEG
jgi:hypothetical protein